MMNRKDTRVTNFVLHILPKGWLNCAAFVAFLFCRSAKMIKMITINARTIEPTVAPIITGTFLDFEPD